MKFHILFFYSMIKRSAFYHLKPRSSGLLICKCPKQKSRISITIAGILNHHILSSSQKLLSSSRFIHKTHSKKKTVTKQIRTLVWYSIYIHCVRGVFLLNCPESLSITATLSYLIQQKEREKKKPTILCELISTTIIQIESAYRLISFSTNEKALTHSFNSTFFQIPSLSASKYISFNKRKTKKCEVITSNESA